MAKSTSKTAQAKTTQTQSAGPVSRSTLILFLCAAAIITFFAYLPALRGPFLFDDLAMPYGQPDAGRTPLRVFLHGVRPLLYSSFWLQTRIWGAEPMGYHAVNVLLHLLNGLMAGWLFARVLSRAGEKGPRKAILSGFALLAFLLHPIQTEAVAYIASLSEVMSVSFFFAAAIVYVKASDAGVTWLRAIAVLLLWGFALTTKEHVFVFPLFLATTDYFWNPGFTLDGIKRNWRLYLLFPALAIAGLIMVRRALGDAATVGFNLPGITWWQYFLTECKAIWVYLRMVILPVGQNLDHGFPLVSTAGDPIAWLGMAGLAGLAALAWVKRRQYPLASYGFFAFTILMAPTSSFLPILDALVERRLYLGFIGLLFIAGEFLRRWKASPSTLASSLAVIALLYAVLSFQRNHVYASTIAMWQDSVAGNPQNDRSFFQLAYAYYREGRCAEAVRNYEQVAKLRPPDGTLLLDWALALDCNGQPDAAIARIKQALALKPGAPALAVLGMIQGKAGRSAEALDSLAQAEKADKSFAMTYVYRGTIYFNLRDYGNAVKAFRRALAADPNNTEAQQKLSQAEAAARQ